MQPSINIINATFCYQNRFMAQSVTQAANTIQEFNNHADAKRLNNKRLLNDKPIEIIDRVWLDKSKQSCLQLCRQHNYTTTEFAHWLAIIDLGVLLVFRQQCCIEVHKGLL